LATKKGIALTATILIGITAASFSVWLIPQDSEIKFTISDYGNYIDEIIERQEIVADGIETQFQFMLDGSISPEEYVTVAELSSSQINNLAIELVRSDASQEWQQSYIHYIESLKKYNDYLRETIVVANTIENVELEGKIQEGVEALVLLKDEWRSFYLRSAETRP